jgi:hypothetical protein
MRALILTTLLTTTIALPRAEAASSRSKRAGFGSTSGHLAKRAAGTVLGTAGMIGGLSLVAHGVHSGNWVSVTGGVNLGLTSLHVAASSLAGLSPRRVLGRSIAVGALATGLAAMGSHTGDLAARFAEGWGAIFATTGNFVLSVFGSLMRS